MKPHGRDCPERCSICLSAPARVITQRGAELLIDGEPARPIEPEQTGGHVPRARRPKT